MTTIETVKVADPAVTGTGSRATRLLGWLATSTMAVSVLFALVLSPPEVNMGDSVRLMYIHLPSIAVAYLAFLATLVGSVVYLRGTGSKGRCDGLEPRRRRLSRRIGRDRRLRHLGRGSRPQVGCLRSRSEAATP